MTIQAHDKYGHMIAHAAIGIAQVSLDGTFLEVNPKYCEITGYEYEELIGRKFQEITHQEDLSPDLKNFENALLGEISSFTMEKRYIKKNGELVWTSLTASLVRDKDAQPKYFVSTVQDITESKLIQKKLEMFNAELEERVQRKTKYLSAAVAELEMARQIADENSNASKAFLAYMSHELRAPIGIIIGYSEIMAENIPSNAGNEFRSWLNTIIKHSKSLLHLVNANLDFSKVDAGKIDLDLSRTNVASLLDEVVYSFDLQAHTKNIRLHVEKSNMDKFEIVTDPNYLRQVLMNLISNAVKFTPDGGEIYATIKRDAENVVMEIRDTGIGMTTEQAESLFRPYSQAHQYIKQKFGGTGLGLALAKKTAQALNGDVRLLESIPEKGSCFEVRVSDYR